MGMVIRFMSGGMEIGDMSMEIGSMGLENECGDDGKWVW